MTVVALAAGVTCLLGAAAFGASAARTDSDDEPERGEATRSLEPDDVDELTGTYQANQVGTADASRYLPGAATAEVAHDRGAYFRVTLRNDAGEIVGAGHRAAHRIRGALEGDRDGYDYVAKPTGEGDR